LAAVSSPDVRFAPESDRLLLRREVTLWANNDISHCGKLPAISAQLIDVRRGVPDRSKYRQAAELAAADIEGHSEAAEYGQPRRLNGMPVDGSEVSLPFSSEMVANAEREIME
jgi:hypothetical protein